jgi:hypothetical protein
LDFFWNRMLKPIIVKSNKMHTTKYIQLLEFFSQTASINLSIIFMYHDERAVYDSQ